MTTQRRRAFVRAACIAAAMLMAAADPANAQRAATGPPDWPCVQRLISELSWGAIWDGPSPEDIEDDWRADHEVARLARLASARSTSEADALEAVRRFAGETGGDRERRLTVLFDGLFEQITRERTRTIAAIQRYARGQVGRLERISTLVDQLDVARSRDEEDFESISRLEQEVFWERRVFEDRQASLRALCEQPYKLEERLSRLVRAIRAEM